MDFAADWRPMTQHQNEVLDRSSFFRFLPEDRADCLRAVLQEEHFEFGDVRLNVPIDAAKFGEPNVAVARPR